MRLRDPAANGEAKSGSSRFAGTDAIDSIEAIENVGDIRRGNTDSGIPNFNGSKLLVPFQANVDFSAARRVLHRIIQHNQKKLL